MTALFVGYWLLLQEAWFFYLCLTVFGLIAGSFCTVLIYRLPLIIEGDTPLLLRPRKISHKSAESRAQPTKPRTRRKPSVLSLTFPSSHCPHCRDSVPWWLNLPLLGFLLAQGKCRKCSKPIAWYYPLAELSCLLLALLAGWVFGPSPTLVPILLLLWGLVALVIIDIRSGLLPDAITLPLLWLGLLLNPLLGSVSLPQALWGVATAWLFLQLVNLCYHSLRRRQAIGGGDIKLFAALGAYVGWQGFLPLLLLASVLGLLQALLNGVLHLPGRDMNSAPAAKNAKKPSKTTGKYQQVMLQEQVWGPHIALAALIYLIVQEKYGLVLTPFTLQ